MYHVWYTIQIPQWRHFSKTISHYSRHPDGLAFVLCRHYVKMPKRYPVRYFLFMTVIGNIHPSPKKSIWKSETSKSFYYRRQYWNVYVQLKKLQKKQWGLHWRKFIPAIHQVKNCFLGRRLIKYQNIPYICLLVFRLLTSATPRKSIKCVKKIIGPWCRERAAIRS
jgi:hypothetical protein